MTIRYVVETPDRIFDIKVNSKDDIVRGMPKCIPSNVITLKALLEYSELNNWKVKRAYV